MAVLEAKSNPSSGPTPAIALAADSPVSSVALVVERSDGLFLHEYPAEAAQLLISSLLKNCFGSPFRASKRRGTSIFVGFSRAAMPYCAHSSTFEILFQQAVSRVTGHL